MGSLPHAHESERARRGLTRDDFCLAVKFGSVVVCGVSVWPFGPEYRNFAYTQTDSSDGIE